MNKKNTVSESAPVNFQGVHQMSDVEKKLADVGRIIMDLAKSEKQDDLSLRLSELGDALTSGTINDQESLISFIKSTPQELKAGVAEKATEAMVRYNQGQRANVQGDEVDAQIEEMRKLAGLS